MFKGTRKYWLIAIIFGLMAAILTYQYLQEVKERYRPDDLVPVVSAKDSISRDSIITREKIEIKNKPGKYTHPHAIKKVDEVVGKIAVSEIAAGEEILPQKLLSSEKASRLSYSIPEKKRAVSIAIDAISGVAGYIQAGDRVDIIATLDIPVADSRGGEVETSLSIITLQDIEVLAVGSKKSTGGKESSGSGTLTLAVSIEQAPPLVLASERGKLRLLLRSPVISLERYYLLTS